MPIRIKSRIVLLSWLINFNSTVLVYGLEKCAPPWQWKLRANALCNEGHGSYSCLYDVIQHNYIESCLGKPDYVKPGKRYVIRGERDNDNCIDSRYQPFKLWSNRSSECEFKKSGCNEKGQVIENNGSTTGDRICRCDYRKGFDFVFKPINVCYCLPSEEDCSCYLKTCLPDAVLTKDYACVSKVNPEVPDGECFPIVETQRPLLTISLTSTSRPSKLPLDDNDEHTTSNKLMSVVVFLLSILMTCASILLTIRFETKRLIAQSEEQSIFHKNRSFLLEEIDTDMLRLALYDRTGDERFSGFDIKLPRKQRATIICDILEELPDSLNILITISEDRGMHLIHNRLKACKQIFSFDSKNILQQAIADNMEDIVERLIDQGLVDEIISVLKESQIVPHKDDIICKIFDKNEEKQITKIIKFVMKEDLGSMLNFVYALYIVGEEEKALMLVQKPCQKY